MTLLPTAVRRITRDSTMCAVTNAAALASEGIYYKPHDTDITKGTALLIGPADTPYYGGYYFFSIEFPTDYPFSPLRVRSLTQDGVTRFNPNMYKDGKVCLSILNTWHDGPQWSGVQSLESVLRVILSDVLSGNPLENEPAFRNCRGSADALKYNRMIMHANLGIIHRMLTRPPSFAEPFVSDVRAAFQTRLPKLLELAEASAVHDGVEEYLQFFAMRVRYAFSAAAENLKSIKN
jgi:ubiquitin-protein ligase